MVPKIELEKDLTLGKRRESGWKRMVYTPREACMKPSKGNFWDDSRRPTALQWGNREFVLPVHVSSDGGPTNDDPKEKCTTARSDWHGVRSFNRAWIFLLQLESRQLLAVPMRMWQGKSS